MQIMISVIDFTNNTLKNPNYLAYGIDLMDLFQNYMNSDVTYDGEAYIKKLDKFKYSTSGSVSGVRSFSQRKLSMSTDMSVLWKDLGGIDMYAQDETMYLIVPMLDNAAYAFDTEVDLFKKGPSLTSDINEEWFSNNRQNIIDFLNSIDINKTGETYTDEDGTVSYEYKMTIPQGQGKFIFDLLGMDMPDHDIIYSMFLDKHYSTKRIEFDLSRALDGASLVVTGDHLNTCIFSLDLPEGEKSVMTIVRNGNITYTNAFNTNITYYTNVGKIYAIDHSTTMDYVENGMSCTLADITLKRDDMIIGEGTCKGTITKTPPEYDVFKDVAVPLDTIEVINWKVVRDDSEAFINDMIDRAKTNLVH